MEYQVFISYKHSSGHGHVTRDYELAKEVFSFLSARGLSVFFSDISIENVGAAEYKRTIDDALEGARVLVAVGSRRESLTSEWVRYEWDGFLNDVLSGFKTGGKVFTYTENMESSELPWALRHTQIFRHGARSMESLYEFIAMALGRETESEVDWLLSAKDSIRMLNSPIADRLAIELTPENSTWMGFAVTFIIDTWNTGHLVVDLDDMNSELRRRTEYDIPTSTFVDGVHTFCIPGKKGTPSPIHYLLYTPLPHLYAINQPILFRSWYTSGVAAFKGLFPLQQTLRPVVNEREKGWCEWLEAFMEEWRTA